MRGPQEFVQEAGLPSVAQTVVPGARGTLPDADPLAGDVIQAIRSGAAGLPFSRNPGALKQGQEDLTTEVIKSLPTSGRITPDNLAPAIFPSLDAGIEAIDRQLSLYARNNINTPEALANTYLGSGNKENSPENRAGYIDAIKSVAGESFNLGNPATRDAIKNAIVNQEFGSAGANVMADMRRGTDASVLGGLNLQQVGTNLPVTSDVNQLGSIDPIGQTQVGIPPVGEQREGSRGDILTSNITGTAPIGTQTAGSRGDIVTPPAPPPIPVVPQDMRDIIAQDENLARIEREQQAIQDARNVGRPTFNLGPGQPGVDIRGPLTARLASVLPDQALETLEGRRDRLPFQVFDSPPIFGLIDQTPDLDTTRSFIGTNIDPETFTGPRRDIPNVGMIGGRRDPAPDTGEPVAELTLDDARAMGDITQERVADILNRPDRYKETFKIGDVEFPNLLATLANKAGSFFDRRLFDAIVSKGLDAVVDPDTGRIIGAKNELGQLIEGRDLEQFQQDDGGEDDPVTKFLKKTTDDQKEEDKEKEDRPPNVFGAPVTQARAERPLVVESPFRQSTASFRPVGFGGGNLNELISRITGVPSPRRMQEGGQVEALDRFLTKVA